MTEVRLIFPIPDNFELEKEQCEAKGKTIDEIFYDVVGGYDKKKEIFGLGSSAELYYHKPESCSNYGKSVIAYAPSEVSRLQKEIEGQQKVIEEQQKELEDQRQKTHALEEKQKRVDEYLAVMKPIFDQLSNGCNVQFPFANNPRGPDDTLGGPCA